VVVTFEGTAVDSMVPLKEDCIIEIGVDLGIPKVCSAVSLKDDCIVEIGVDLMDGIVVALGWNLGIPEAASVVSFGDGFGA